RSGCHPHLGGQCRGVRLRYPGCRDHPDGRRSDRPDRVADLLVELGWLRRPRGSRRRRSEHDDRRSRRALRPRVSIIGWILLGLCAGVIAKAIMPGAERMGLVLTTLLGIGGALLGGFIAKALGLGRPIDTFFDLSTWVAAVAGAIVILA